MDELNEYEVVINGVVHTFQMTAEDAKAHGAVPVKKAAPKPKNKARKPANKDA